MTRKISASTAVDGYVDESGAEVCPLGVDRHIRIDLVNEPVGISNSDVGDLPVHDVDCAAVDLALRQEEGRIVNQSRRMLRHSRDDRRFFSSTPTSN